MKTQGNPGASVFFRSVMKLSTLPSTVIAVVLLMQPARRPGFAVGGGELPVRGHEAGRESRGVSDTAAAMVPAAIIAPQRSSESSPSEAPTTGNPVTMVPERTQPRVLGAKRGAMNPSLISRVTAKRS